MSSPDPEAPSILHNKSERASWSRANEKGVFPGVSSPLNWSIWGEIGERAVRRGAFDLGLLDEHELALPASVDDWGWSIFYGRPTANVDVWRALYERGLGGEGQGAATQQQVFGGAVSTSAQRAASTAASTAASSPASAVSAASPTSAARDRRAILAAKRPVALATSPPRLAATRREAIAWWGEATRAIAAGGVDAAERAFREALALFERADRDHIVVSLLSTEAVTTLSAMAAAAGRPEAANALMVGYPGMEEFETAVAVWDLSRGRITLAEFLAEHGFHGSMEGEIASRSWREDPEPVRALAERYAKLPEVDDPRRREARAVEQRERLEAELRAVVPPAERLALDRAFALAATCLPMREAGRATLTIALDAMRAAARRLGAALAAGGRLDAAEDVFLLTRFDLLGEGEGDGAGEGGGDGTGADGAGRGSRGGAGASDPSTLRERAERHRALVRAYEAFDLPETWQGMPPKLLRTSRAEAVRAQVALSVGERLEGLGASAGVHEGIARVVLDPADPALEFEAGDVLVAPATDPSWAPLFLVAGAVVIDTGSNISHAAVVAREMGIPAVVAARDASLRLRSGQRLRVDGRAGIVEIVAGGA